MAAIPIAAILVIGIAAGVVAGRNSGDETAVSPPMTPNPSTLVRTESPSPTDEPVVTIVEQYDPPVEVYFAPAEHIGYRFGDNGSVIDETTYGLGHQSAALADAEVVDREGVHYFRMVSGVFDGYLVPASEVVSLVGP